MEAQFALTLAHMSQMIEQLTKDKSDLQATLKEAKDDRDLLFSTCTDLNKEVEALQQEREESEARHSVEITRLTEEINELREQSFTNAEVHKDFAAHLEELATENGHLKDKVDHLNQALQEKERQLKAQEAKQERPGSVGSFEKVEKTLRNEIKELQEQNDRLQLKLMREKKMMVKQEQDEPRKYEETEADQWETASLPALLDQANQRKRLAVRSSSLPTHKRNRSNSKRSVIAVQPYLPPIVEGHEEGN
uniref:HOOK domain-containing protein n=1 Tax=Steinernema glaseri TaxID=37863 RepID=A0A1I7ZAH3_9BILA